MKNKYITAIISKVKKQTDKIKTFHLETAIKAKPGQYIMVWLPQVNEKPFAVLSADPLIISVAKVGDFTRRIHQLKKNDKITFRGPYGSSFTSKGEKMLLVGGGYGVFPLYFLASSLVAFKRKNIIVIIGARTKSDLSFVAQFKKLGCQVKVSTDDGSLGFKGFSTQLAGKILNKVKIDSLYTCGPEIMMRKMALMAKEKKIFCQISMERYFKCGGIGLCGECSFEGMLVCKQGPVFSGKVLLKNIKQ